MRKQKPVVYQILNIITGTRYIGKANVTRMRWRAHRTDLTAGTHHNKFLQRDWNTYGPKQFEFSVIGRYSSAEMALAAEVRFIAKYRAAGFVLYNATAGGEAGSPGVKLPLPVRRPTVVRNP